VKECGCSEVNLLHSKAAGRKTSSRTSIRLIHFISSIHGGVAINSVWCFGRPSPLQAGLLVQVQPRKQTCVTSMPSSVAPFLTFCELVKLTRC
jgi:hypothetical protein